MKTLIQGLILVAVFFLNSCTGQTQSSEPLTENATSRVEVIDFHTDHRCNTCVTIEKLTKEVLSQSFAQQMDEGLITFQLVNVDKEENFPMAQKFGAFGTTLMLNVINNGQEKQVDITDFAFMSANNEEKFTQGLLDRINAELKSL